MGLSHGAEANVTKEKRFGALAFFFLEKRQKVVVVGAVHDAESSQL